MFKMLSVENEHRQLPPFLIPFVKMTKNDMIFQYFIMLQAKHTKIICTIGPASRSAEKIKKMVDAGMNAARLNLSHGNYTGHRELIAAIRAADRSLGEPLTIIGDLQGPKIRVGDLSSFGLNMTAGQTVEIPVSHPSLYRDVKRGDRIMIEDGLMDGICAGGRPGFLKIKARVGGTLFAHKGLNFPDSTLRVSALSPKDRSDAVFCVKQKMHWVALSFVTKPADVRELRLIMKRASRSKKELPGIIAKIEKHEAVRNFDAILKEADAVMVARGDLGVEIPAERVPLVQKEIIEKCRAAGKPVIVATQMLDSMTRNPRPTRAEVSDVANAVIDHADAVMLSGETASGKYPVESVATMSKIIRETEASPFDDVPLEEAENFLKMADSAMSGAANMLARTLHASAILVATLSGNTARIVSRFRPELPIIAATASEFVRRQINLSWGVIPITISKVRDIDELIIRAAAKIKREKLLRRGSQIIILAGQPVGRRVNFVEVKKI
jgi:pyruvate kinase